MQQHPQQEHGLDESMVNASAKPATATWTKWKNRGFKWPSHNNIDCIFYRIGLSISTKPWLWLLISLLISCVFGSGMFLWKEEIDDVKLFMPLDSIIRHDAEWVKEHFRDDLRYESILITAPNVLKLDVIRLIRDIENSVKTIVVNNHTWFDVCAGYFTWFNGDTDDEEDTLSHGIFEQINDTVSNDKCIYQSLLKVWMTDRRTKKIDHLKQDEVLRDITEALRDEANGNILLDVGPLLSGIEYDEEGRVKSAKATILNWMLKKSHPQAANWELEFINRVLHKNYSLPPGVEIYAVATRSFKDILHEILDSNITVLFCGLSLILIYVMMSISRCNTVEQRFYLSVMGIIVVGLALLSSYGLCFYMGFFFGPVHPILPFLLLGIGVDDMFVIMQSLKNLSKQEKSLKISSRVAKALQHSGVSITVTSFTNMVAFGVGITASMPFLQSFCLFASMGILFLYIFEITFFVSCLVYDERRIESKKDGCCCQPLPNWKPALMDRRNLQQRIFDDYVGPYILKKPIKVIILTSTLCLVIVNSWAIFQLDRYFDPLSYLNQHSYPIQFNNKLTEYFPKYGKRVNVYVKGVDYYADHDKLIRLVDTLRDNPYINNRTLDPWFVAYDRWLKTNNQTNRIQGSHDYYENLSQYLLFTKEGQGHIKDIKFNTVPIGEYNITVSKIEIQHIPMRTTSDQIHAMQSVREAIKATNFSQGHDHIAIFSQDYISWTANKIIGEELIRNLSLEIFAIGLITIALLRNIRGSVWVICCVFFTVIDLLGSMYFLGLTIEIASSIMILLCAGLAVDYAAHIGLEFTRAKGTKNERCKSTLSVIGPAVFNGGISTFLAFILLSISDAYIFTTFFKLCTAVVVFGLFHGLLFLPVILSLLGPNEQVDVITQSIVLEQNKYYTVQLQRKKRQRFR